MIQNEKLLLIGKVLSSVNMLENQKLRLLDIKNNNISSSALISFMKDLQSKSFK